MFGSDLNPVAPDHDVPFFEQEYTLDTWLAPLGVRALMCSHGSAAIKAMSTRRWMSCSRLWAEAGTL
jgi:hypothetical protein